MNQVNRVREAILSVRRSGATPTCLIVGGNIQVMVRFETTILDEPLSIPKEDMERFIKIMLEGGDLKKNINRVIREAITHQWSQARLATELNLRVKLSEDFRLSTEQAVIEGYIEGAQKTLELLLERVGSDLYWNERRPYRLRPNDDRDWQMQVASVQYHKRYDNSAYHMCLESLDLTGSVYENAVNNAIIDAAMAVCGSPYTDKTCIYRILEYLDINPAPVAQYLELFK